MSHHKKKSQLPCIWENNNCFGYEDDDDDELSVCSYHITYMFQSESTLHICQNVKELLAPNRRDIWSLCHCNGTRTHNHLVRKRTLNHLVNRASLPKWLNVRLRSKSSWVWVLFQSFNLQISRLFRARSFLTFRQI